MDPSLMHKSIEPKSKTLHTATWTHIEESMQCRANHASVVCKGFLITFGGAKDAGPVLEAFDLKKQCSVPVRLSSQSAPTPLNREGHTMCVDKNDNIIVFGGSVPSGSLFTPGSYMLASLSIEASQGSVEVEWKTLDNNQGERPIRKYHTADIYENKMYVFGGLNERHETVDDLWQLDLDTQLFTPGVHPSKRFSHCGTIYDSKLYIFGGDNYANKMHNDFYALDLKNMSWTLITQTEKTPKPQAGSSLKGYGGNLYLFGRHRKYNKQGGLSEVCVYSVKNETWEEVIFSEAPAPRFSHSCAIWGSSLYFMGGLNVENICLNDLWCLDLEGKKPIKKEEDATNLNSKKTLIIENKTFDLIKLFNQKTFADIILEVEDKQFPTHKAILAQRCRFFANLFNSGMSDANLERLRITDVNAESFEVLLRFIYSDPNLTIDEDLAFELVRLSDKYLLPELKTQCEKVLIELLSLDNFTQAAEVAEVIESEVLMKAVFKFAKWNIKVLKERGDLYKLPQSILLQLFAYVISN